MELKKKKEIDLADAIIRMIQQPGSVTVYQPIEKPEDMYTINDLKGLSVNDGAVFMVDDEEPEPVAKSSSGSKTSEIDDGKILALYEAQRTPAWIAADMGISEQTVRNHLKRMGILTKKDRNSEENENAGKDG